MPDAADRIRVEPKSPAAKRIKAKPKRTWMRALRALAPKSRSGFAGAALFAMMIGIVVNAVALQHGRRVELPPDPATTTDARSPVTTAALVPAPSAVAAPPSVSAAEPPPTPPARPAPAPTTLAHLQKPADPIAELLRANSGDNRRLVSTAQGALAKLGFPVKATGSLDAETRSAVVAFEKSRRLPISTEITAKLVKSLTAAAAN